MDRDWPFEDKSSRGPSPRLQKGNTASNINEATQATVIKDDDKYYIQDADCVILVDNVLFKVHRFLLSRDTSVFQDMFSMPIDAKSKSNAEGYSDEDPIVLYGDSADSFRALMWVLYALPPELEVMHSADADIDLLVTIAEITNKYHFCSLEKWAVEAMHKVLSGVYGPPTFVLARSDRLSRILEMSIICNHARLRDLVVTHWTGLVLSRGLEPTAALVVADKYKLRLLLGVAYYVQLMAVGSRFTVGDNLSTEQRVRLMSGHWSLVNLWDRLRINPPKFEKGTSGCVYHNNGCVSIWTAVWLEVGKSEKTLAFGSADVMGRLRCMQEQLSWNPDLASSLTPQCRRAALAALQEMVKGVEEKLADHFNDVSLALSSTR